MARASFILFLLLSIPVGIHHQYADPGIHRSWKLLHAFLSFAVFLRGLLIFFNVVASLENGAWVRGGQGLVWWFTKLPWNDPSLVAQVLAMLMFAFGGISGLINASYNVNLVVHNTAWVPGHFHLTVGTAVTLTYIGISYWLVPYLRGRELWNQALALVQAWLWFVGMGIFSHSMHRLGLMGVPPPTDDRRRTCWSSASGSLAWWITTRAIKQHPSNSGEHITRALSGSWCRPMVLAPTPSSGPLAMGLTCAPAITCGNACGIWGRLSTHI
jgi:heme/copper-type cytochrome/quinol oxidase subunit 1